MSKKDEPKSDPMNSNFTPDDVARSAGSTPRHEDTKAAKATPESDRLNHALETSQKRHTAIGGPFTKASIDPTETEEALEARGSGPKSAAKVSIRGADKGRKLYRTKQPHYRQGLYIEANSIISVPADEKPSRTWEEADQKNDVAHFILDALPEPSEEDKKRSEEMKERERAVLAARRVFAGR